MTSTRLLSVMALAGALAMSAAPEAAADRWGVSIGPYGGSFYYSGTQGSVRVGTGYASPYYAPASYYRPTYYAPATTYYYTPAPTYYVPARTYCAPARSYYGGSYHSGHSHRHDYHRHSYHRHR